MFYLYVHFTCVEGNIIVSGEFLEVKFRRKHVNGLLLFKFFELISTFKKAQK